MNIAQVKKLAGRILSVPLIRKFANRFQLVLYRMLSKSKLLAVPFHLIFSRAFDREIFAYTNAIHQYNRNILHVLTSNVVLRRNIHRLEKGLIMEKRRPVFALDYIQETLETYAAVLNNPQEVSIELGEVHWAHDVLEEYFTVTDPTHPLIQRLKQKFEDLPQPAEVEKSERFVPFERKLREDLDIPTYQSFLDLSLKRRSVRWFQDKPVPRELVDKALVAASLAPSACNRQPFHYRIFDDPQLVSKVVRIPFNTAGFADNIPMVIVVVGDLSNFFSPRDRHVVYIDAALSIMSFIYALETLGLSSVTINCPDFGIIENRFKKQLKLKPYERPVLMIGVGYAKSEGRIPYSTKKPLDLIRSYNEIGIDLD
ncbi:MAG: nitroreductase family protein [Chloroflexi bacterium]|nr:nitroreductase family protein [Chloroflexota bacterium]